MTRGQPMQNKGLILTIIVTIIVMILIQEFIPQFKDQLSTFLTYFAAVGIIMLLVGRRRR